MPSDHPAGATTVAVVLFAVPAFGMAVGLGRGATAGSDGSDVLLTLLAVCTAIGAGLLWHFMVAAGDAARRDTRELLRFRERLRTTVVVTCVLTLAQTAILVLALAPLGLSPFMLLFGVAPAGLFAVVQLVRAWRGPMSNRTVTSVALPVPTAATPRLWRLIDDLSERLAVRPPDHVLVGHDAAFFVTPLTVTTPFGAVAGRTLCCSLSLTRILAARELAAIVAHELAHFSEDDLPFTTGFYPSFRSARVGIRILRARPNLYSVLLLPAIAVLEFLVEEHAPAADARGRVRERAADARSAAATSPRDLATALVKVNAFAPLFGEAVRLELESVQATKVVPRFVDRFAAVAASKASTVLLEGEDGLPHAADSHLPLALRLEALGVSTSDVAADALVVDPTEPASDVLPEIEELERLLVQAYGPMSA